MLALDQIKSRITIEDILSERGIHLKKGRCRCPLHGGENPTSFSVSEDGRYFHCFSCGQRGTVVDLVIGLYSLDTRGAIQLLAQRAGIVLDKTAPPKRRRPRRKLRPTLSPQLKLRVVEAQQRIYTRKLKALNTELREGRISLADYERETQKVDAILEGIDGVFVGLDALACLYTYDMNQMKKRGVVEKCNANQTAR